MSRMPSARTTFCVSSMQRARWPACDPRRHPHLDRVRADVLELEVVELETPPGGELLVVRVAGGLEHAAGERRCLLNERHGQIAADDELLDQHARGKARDQLERARGQLLLGLDHRVDRNADRRALEVRLHDQREPQLIRELQLRHVFDEAESRRGRRRVGRPRAW